MIHYIQLTCRLEFEISEYYVRQVSFGLCCKSIPAELELFMSIIKFCSQEKKRAENVWSVSISLNLFVFIPTNKEYLLEHLH